ncbi:ran GTPase-activating protein 1-like isoform X2 [Monodelphis domestica]|uniref:ran GTPase-activating protein 1-like isoform X2 n=1 Tax=Monodelphis domestica TaxID=13616 RepID=UPI000443598A|nr:ran GTPase-activating protein 1-like isoform X2 [Monodelphis domestica]
MRHLRLTGKPSGSPSTMGPVFFQKVGKAWPRFLLPVSLLILFLALVATEDHLVSTLKTLYEVEAPLSKKRILQTQGEGNTIESEFQDEPDSDSSEDEGSEDLGDEDEEEEEEEEDSPFQKTGGELSTLHLDPRGRECVSAHM